MKRLKAGRRRRLLWIRRSAAVSILAALLSLVMVTPSVAADGWIPDEKRLPVNERYKFGYDYYKRELGTGQTYTYKFGDKIPVSGSVNPSGTTPSVPTNTSNTPLTGKIIEPGKTPAKPPALYTRLPGLLGPGALGASRLLGTAGVGIGGVSAPVGNFREVALAQGVTAACLDSTGPGVCTSDEISKQFKISSCSHLTGTSSCSSIGAKNEDGTPMTNLMETIIPLASDLWAWLTGQGGDKQQPVNGHYNVTSNGCKGRVEFEKRDGANGTFHVIQTERKTRPASGATAQNAWDAACATDNANTMTPLNLGAADRVQTECIDPATGLTASGPTSTNPYGIDLGLGTGLLRSDGTNISNLCDNPGYTLMKVKVYNSQPQSYFDMALSNSNVFAAEFTEWLNPDPALDTIPDTTITTNWTCRDRFGTEHQLSRTVTKVSGLVEPACPLGTDLVKHDVQALNPGALPTTIDSGTENAAQKANYPLCTGQPCALTVKVDGVTCTALMPSCQTWPQIYASSPSRVDCSWGTYTLPTDNCLTLSNAYKSERGVVFEPKSQTWTAVDTFGNPVAPNPEPWNPTNPTPTTGVSPATGTITPTTPGTSSPTIPVEGTNPQSDFGAKTGCMGTTWSWNPVSWVQHPVACVLEWAFEPDQQVFNTKGQQVRDKLGELGIDGPIAAIESTVSALPQGGGCAGPTVVFQVRTVYEEIRPLNACAEPLATVANFANAAGSLYLVLFGSIGVVKAISSAFGFQWYFGQRGGDS